MLPVATKATTMVSLQSFKQWLGITSSLTKTITSLTSVGLVATAVCANHGYQTNAFVVIAGSAVIGYNGSFLITVLDANTFTFPLAATATSPATGTPTVTLDDGRYAMIADAATADIENPLDMFFVKRSRTERFNGDGKADKVLDHAPIVTVDTFTIDGVAIDAADYVLDLEAGIVHFLEGGSFTPGIQNCVVTYTAGYDVQDGAALPSDAVRAALDLGKAMHDELVAHAIAASTVSLGPSSLVVKIGKYPPSVQRVLDSYSGKGYRP